MKAAWPVGRALFGPEGQPGGGLSRCGAGHIGMGTSAEAMGMMETGCDGDQCRSDGYDGDGLA